MKEDELSKSIIACRTEAGVLNTWINFLKDTQVLQCSYAETKNKQISDELERHEDYFVNFAISLLSAYKEDLGPSVSRIEKFVVNLKKLSERSELASTAGNEGSDELYPRKLLEEEYLENETKIITTFSVVDNMKARFDSKQGASSRKDDPRIKELFDEMEKLREKFEFIERPVLQIEAPPTMADAPSNEKPPESSFDAPTLVTPPMPDNKEVENDSPPVEAQPVLDHEAELAKLEFEFGDVGRDRDYLPEEIGDWEFDELERELKAGDSSPGK